jgi:hypothetical protein
MDSTNCGSVPAQDPTASPPDSMLRRNRARVYNLLERGGEVGQPDRGDVTRLLQSWSDGDKGALGDLVPLVYRELRSLAAAYIRRERRDHTLQPTSLVHEAYLRLVDQTGWRARAGRNSSPSQPT